MTAPSEYVRPGESLHDAAARVPQRDRKRVIERVDRLVAELLDPTGTVSDAELTAWVGSSVSLTFFGVAVALLDAPTPDPKSKSFVRNPGYLRLLGFQYLTVRTGDGFNRPSWWSGEEWQPSAPERVTVRPKLTGEPYCTCSKTAFIPLDEGGVVWLCARCSTPVRPWLHAAGNYLPDFKASAGTRSGETLTAAELASDDAVLTEYRITADTGKSDLFGFGEPSFLLKPYETGV